MTIGPGRRSHPQTGGEDRHHLPAPGDLPAILVDEGPLGSHHAELVALRVGEDGPGLGASLADVHPPSTKLPRRIAW
jgi:hypothetical protein